MSIATRVIRDTPYATVLAFFDMTAQRRRSTGNDRTHDAAFTATEMGGMIPKIGGPMLTKNVSEL
jgi:hypothetical protein